MGIIKPNFIIALECLLSKLYCPVSCFLWYQQKPSIIQVLIYVDHVYLCIYNHDQLDDRNLIY